MMYLNADAKLRFIGEKLQRKKWSLLKKLRKTFNQLRGKNSRKLCCVIEITQHITIFSPF